jgi:hypothetical protein
MDPGLATVISNHWYNLPEQYGSQCCPLRQVLWPVQVVADPVDEYGP